VSEKLNPGDKVIALASAACTAAVLAGIVAGCVLGWITKHNLIITGAFVISGAIIGLAVGTVVGKVLFPAQAGQVMVMKTGRGSIHANLKGNVIASTATGIIICSLAILIFKAAMIIALLSLGISVALGVAFALAGSLL
jgi:hypothetical protein